MPTVLSTSSDEILTTDRFAELAVDFATSNADQQAFDFYVNLLQSLLWQYNSAANIRGLIEAKQDWYNTNQKAFWEGFVTNIFDLATANDFGLSVWSILLGLPLYNNQGATPSGVLSFGFGPDNGNFNNSNFGSLSGHTVNLPIETKRIALQLRYFQLCSSGTVPEINRFMAYVFRNYGSVYLIDNHDMTQQYVFGFTLSWSLQFLFDNFDILPRPAGVQTIIRDATQNTWGFGTARLNFDNGNFGSS